MHPMSHNRSCISTFLTQLTTSILVQNFLLVQNFSLMSFKSSVSWLRTASTLESIKYKSVASVRNNFGAFSRIKYMHQKFGTISGFWRNRRTTLLQEFIYKIAWRIWKLCQIKHFKLEGKQLQQHHWRALNSASMLPEDVPLQVWSYDVLALDRCLDLILISPSFKLWTALTVNHSTLKSSLRGHKARAGSFLPPVWKPGRLEVDPHCCCCQLVVTHRQGGELPSSSWVWSYDLF